MSGLSRAPDGRQPSEPRRRPPSRATRLPGRRVAPRCAGCRVHANAHLVCHPCRRALAAPMPPPIRRRRTRGRPTRRPAVRLKAHCSEAMPGYRRRRRDSRSDLGSGRPRLRPDPQPVGATMTAAATAVTTTSTTAIVGIRAIRPPPRTSDPSSMPLCSEGWPDLDVGNRENRER